MNASSQKLRIGVIAVGIPGHMNALNTLGNELKRRGHSVVLMGGRNDRRFAERFQLEFLPIGVEGDLDLKLEKMIKDCGNTVGLAAKLDIRRSSFVHSKIILNLFLNDSDPKLNPATCVLVDELPD